MRSYVLPYGNLSLDTNLHRAALPIQLFINDNRISIAAGQPFVTPETTISIYDSDPNSYPFDHYESSFYVTAVLNGTTSQIPIAMSVVSNVQSWYVTADVEDSLGSTEVWYVLVAKRSWTTLFFSIFVFLLTYMLSLSALVLAVTLWFRKRKVEPPTIGVCAALLFALPAVRNTQPVILVSALHAQCLNAG